MSDLINNTILSVVENYTSIKDNITFQLKSYQEEINNLVFFQEVINKLNFENNNLKLGIELKDKEIFTLKEQIGDKINFNNVSMLKRQDKEIYELKNKISYLEKQISFYKLQTDNLSNRRNSSEIILTKNQIKDNNEFIKNELTTNSEDSNILNNEKDQSLISIDEEINEEKIIKKKVKKQKIDKKKVNNLDKLTKDEEEELEMYEDGDKDYYIHNSTNRVFEILENNEVGKLIGIIKKNKLVKIN